MITQNGTVLRIHASVPSMPVRAELQCPRYLDRVIYTVLDADGTEMAFGMSDGMLDGTDFEFLADGELWTPDHPTTYTLRMRICYADGTEEEIEDRFGYRTISSDSKYIYLNGYPFYMRAYIRGAAAHEHGNLLGLSEYDFYKKSFLAARRYGFNAVRFHTTVPSEECFRAADDTGVLIHIEMRTHRDKYDNLKEMLYGKDVYLTDEEVTEISNRLYNHPSFMVYCIGNELRQPASKPRIREIAELIKRIDPSRLFIDTCAHGEYDRDYVDIDVQHMSYFFPYGRNADMFSNTDNLLCFGTARGLDMTVGDSDATLRRAISFDRPLIAHEICHYTAWRDFYALKRKFEECGAEKPWWIEEEIKLVEKKGLTEEFPKLYSLTKAFQLRCWKTALESLRASDLLSGFHMLQFADTDKYENSNGIVDCFDDPAGVPEEAFRAFNGDTVLLMRSEERIFTAGERVHIPMMLSRYTIDPAPTADFSFELTCGGELLRSGAMTRIDTAECGLYRICKLELLMPEVADPKKLELKAKLVFSDGSVCENSWELWLFPRYRLPLADCRVDMNASYLENVLSTSDTARVTVTDKPDDALFRRLENGERVVLLYRTDWTRHLLHKDMTAPDYSFRAVWDRYKGVIWDRGTQNGGYDAADVLRRYGFPADGELNYHYYSLIDDSDKINLDDFPVRPRSLVSGIDKACRDRFDPKKFGEPELMPDRTMRRFSYLFELAVGEGRLLVCGFNLTGATVGDPAALAMIKFLVDYAASDDFSPTSHITPGELRAYLSAVAAQGPQKERMMTQYWQLDAEPVESMDYWTESERYLRE